MISAGGAAGGRWIAAAGRRGPRGLTLRGGGRRGGARSAEAWAPGLAFEQRASRGGPDGRGAPPGDLNPGQLSRRRPLPWQLSCPSVVLRHLPRTLLRTPSARAAPSMPAVGESG